MKKAVTDTKDKAFNAMRPSALTWFLLQKTCRARHLDVVELGHEIRRASRRGF